MLGSLFGLALKWKPQLLLAGGAAALSVAFGAGWQVATWRADAAFAAERLATAAEAREEAEAKAAALETQAEATRAAEARVVSLRARYTKLQEALAEIDDDGSCGLDIERVRLIANGVQ